MQACHEAESARQRLWVEAALDGARVKLQLNDAQQPNLPPGELNPAPI